MRAVIHNQVLSTLTLKGVPYPKPDFSAREHLIRVHAVALTRGELTWPRPPPLDQDYSPAVEMCGTVAEAPSTSKFPAGSRVFMRTTYPRDASLREFTIGLESELAKVPSNLTDNEAAAVPVSALTAWQGLFVHGSNDFENSRGKRVLVNGAAGAVGMWYVQLARAAGMIVVGTCNPASAERVRAAGAEVIDYTTNNLREYPGEKFDLILDAVGGKSLEDAWFLAKDNGRVLTIVPPTDFFKHWNWDLDRPEGVSETVQGRFFVMNSSGNDLARVGKLIEAGQAKPIIDSVWKLEDFEKAFEKLESGKTNGKIVVRVAEE
jgi:NADPH:quinone reductase-like Zn-dependent oxidoreductase